MSTKLGLKNETQCRFYVIPDEGRSLTAVGEQLYRTDPQLIIAKVDDGSGLILYDTDGVFPLGVADPPDPDDTMAYCDVDRTKRKVAKARRARPKWLNFNTIVYVVIGLVILYYVVRHYIM